MRIATAVRDSSVEDLAALARRPDIPVEVRPWIEHELRAARRGRRGERAAEYDIEFHFGARSDIATIHGLRLEYRGRVAQIDHLLLTRFLDIWVCESKAYKGRVEINEYGEWQVAYGSKTYGMPSPVLQTWKHMDVLGDVFNRRKVAPPVVLGQMMFPTLNGVVLFSNDARITRPVGPSAQLDAELKAVMKVERLPAMVELTMRERISSESPRELSPEALVGFGRRIAALHMPRKTDWAAKFGLTDAVPTPIAQRPLEPQPARVIANVVEMNTVTCGSCGVRLRRGEIDYCTDQADLFHGRLLCWRCQHGIDVRATS